jgi:PAS domain S-box-containing protein
VGSNFQHKWTWHFAKWLLLIWLPLILVLAVVLWLSYHTETTARMAITRADEQYTLQLASQTIASELATLRGDVLYLAQHASLHHWLQSGRAADRRRFADDLLHFARYRGLYDQIRFLDAHGREEVRINWNDGQPEIVPAGALQDKSDRYYVRDTLALNEGALYLSPFDLNVEQGVIEQPLKPMIRLGTPVFDKQGRKLGIIILNYMGQRLLDRLREIHSQHGGELSLLNGDGYWLLGPRPEMEWGFMYPERETQRFGNQYQRIWTSLQTGPQHEQLLRAAGLFTYRLMDPGVLLNGVKGERWILLSQVPAAALAAAGAESLSSYVGVFVMLALLLAAGSGVITYFGIQRRRAEARIRLSEARYRGLLDSAPDAIVIVDQGGRITLVNSQAEKCFGYSRDELLGQTVETLLPERFRQRHVGVREGYIGKPTSRSMGEDVDLIGVRKDGSEFPVEISLSPLESEQGLLITSIVRDITARKQAEQAKQQVQARYQELVNNLPVGVYRNTPGASGRFLEVNPAMAEIFEAQSTEELLGHAVSDLYCDPAARKAFADKALAQGQASEELHLKTLRGREFYAAITAVVKQDANGESYFDGIVEDISARKESELHIRQLNHILRGRSAELETINGELEAFSYSVSHDLRAPLRAIDGFSRTLLSDYSECLDDKGKDRLARVRAAAQRMAALIDDLLKLSRVSRTELHRETVDLGQLSQEVVETLREGEPQRAVAFSVQSDLATQGDPRLLRVVMDNLLGNAWKFTGQRPDAQIEVGGHAEEENFVYFVRDNGAGFDMNYANKLFGAFQRLHDADEFPGTGIGLATVQRVIHKHGGRIWAEGAVDQGASFYFTLGGNGHEQ